MDLRNTVESRQSLCERHIPLLMLVGGDLHDNESSRKKKRGPLTKSEEAELMRRYVDLDEDTFDLAREYGLSIFTLRNIASKNGVKRPRRYER